MARLYFMMSCTITAFAWLAACGSSGDNKPATDSNSTTDGAPTSDSALHNDSPEPHVPCNEPQDGVDLQGLFALSANLSFTFGSESGGAVTVCPKHQTQSGYFLGLIQITHSRAHSQAEMKAIPCSLQLPAVSAIAGTCAPDASNLVSAGIVFPQKLVDAMPVSTQDTTTATMHGSLPHLSFSTGLMNFSIGTKQTLANAPHWLIDKPGCGVTDLTPGRASQCDKTCVSDCNGLVDHDRDNWPGATVLVCGYTPQDKRDGVVCHGEEPNQAGTTIQGRALMNLFVQQVALTGNVNSSCELTGTVDANVVYHLIGADVYVANTQISVASAIKSLPSYQLNASQSHFRLLRIDGRHGAPDWNASFSEPVEACRQVISHKNMFQ